MLIFLLSLCHAVEIANLSLEYKQIAGGSYAPELPQGSIPRGELNLDIDLMIMSPIYWKNRVHSMIDQNQFRLIGWHFELGAFVTPNVQIYFEHHSQHILDSQSENHFPVLDAVGVRIIFL